MDIDDNQPEGGRGKPVLLPAARWPPNSPLSSTEIELAQRHTVLSINRFLAQHGIDERYRSVFPGLVIPMAAWLLRRQRDRGGPLVVGLSGCPGSGRLTLALALQLVLRDGFVARTCVLSLSDFSLSLAKRRALARASHPLLETRGLPGTHDIALLQETLDQLLCRGSHEIRLPAFDRVNDTPFPEDRWPSLPSGHEIIILEGWCVGAEPENEADLMAPVSDSEQTRDETAVGRITVNQALATGYASLWARLGSQIFLKAPDWHTAYLWHTEQLGKQHRQGAGPEALRPDDVRQRVAPFRRVTESMRRTLPQKADITLSLNASRQLAHLQRIG